MAFVLNMDSSLEPRRWW